MVLPGGGPMEAMGVQKLRAEAVRALTHAVTPIHYVGLAADVLGRMPCPSSSSATLLRPSHTSSASTGAPGFRMGWHSLADAADE